jgi:WD40 repeat protein
VLIDSAASAALYGTSSSTVTALATGLLQSIRVAAWKTAAAILLTLGWSIAGLGWAAWALGVGNSTPPPVADQPPAAVENPGDPAEGRQQESQKTKPLDAPPKRVAPMQHAGPVTCVALAPDGLTMASGSEGTGPTIRLWEIATGRPIHQIYLKSSVFAIALSRDGVLAVGCEDRSIRLFEAKTAKPLKTLQGHQDTVPGKDSYFPPGTFRGVSSLLFTDDGKTLISGGYDGTVRLWDVATGKQIDQLTLAGHRVHCLALSHDGKTLAAGCEEPGSIAHHRVHLWEMPKRQPIRPDLPRFKGIYSTGPVRALAFAPDGKRLAVGGFDNELIVWDVSTGKTVGAYRAGFLIIQSLAFSPRGDRLAAGCMDGRIQFWNASTADPSVEVAASLGQPSARTSGVSSVVFASDGRTLISGGSDRRVHLWDVASGKDRTSAD